MDVFMDVTGRKYLSETAKTSACSKLPVCTQELYDILAEAGKPLNDEEIRDFVVQKGIKEHAQKVADNAKATKPTLRGVK